VSEKPVDIKGGDDEARDEDNFSYGMEDEPEIEEKAAEEDFAGDIAQHHDGGVQLSITELVGSYAGLFVFGFVLASLVRTVAARRCWTNASKSKQAVEEASATKPTQPSALAPAEVAGEVC